MISALMPFLGKSPATSATHNTPWLGETAENATLTLSAAKLGRAKKITSRTLNPRTGNFLMPDRDRGQNIMDPGRLFCVRRRFPKPSTAGFSRTIVESMSSVKHNQGQQLRCTSQCNQVPKDRSASSLRKPNAMMTADRAQTSVENSFDGTGA